MKVVSKVATGTGILTVLLFVVLGYHVFLVRHVAAVNRSLSDVHFAVARELRSLERDLADLRRSRQKVFVVQQLDIDLPRNGDIRSAPSQTVEELQEAGYAEHILGLRRSLAAAIERLRRQDLDPIEREVFAGIVEAWARAAPLIEVEIGALRTDTLQPSSEAGQLSWALDAMRRAVIELEDTNVEAVERRAAQAEKASDRAERLMWIGVSTALAVGVVVVWLTLRSIRRPLLGLVAATRDVGAGRFSVQVESSRDDEFAQLGHAFNAMVRRLDELDRVKRDFIAHLSHELKTPLATMLETDRLLLEEIPGPLNERQARFLRLNLESGDRLATMISNLLDLSHIEAGMLELRRQPQDLVDVVADVVEAFRPRARERGSVVTLEVPPTSLIAPCDRDRIVQVLENLLDNALKYASGTPIQVHLSCLSGLPSALPSAVVERLAVTPPASALLVVQDGGRGVPRGEHERVFDRFHQAGGVRGRRGVGLGLAICREIVEAHGGLIWIVDSISSGARVAVMLPAERLSMVAPVSPPVFVASHA